MGILIKDMEMPKEGRLTLQISADGAVYVVNSCSITAETYTTDAVPVPPHGRLIDADALDVIGYCDIPQGREDTFDDGVMWLAEQIDLLPTIIPTEEGE